MTLAVTMTRACLVSYGNGPKPHRALGCQQRHKCLGACEWVDRNLMGNKPTNPHTGNLYALKEMRACARAPPLPHVPSSSVASLFLIVLLAVPAVSCPALSLVSVGFSWLFLPPCFFSSSVLASGRIQTRKTASQDSRCSSPSPLISFGFPMA